MSFNLLAKVLVSSYCCYFHYSARNFGALHSFRNSFSSYCSRWADSSSVYSSRIGLRQICNQLWHKSPSISYCCYFHYSARNFGALHSFRNSFSSYCSRWADSSSVYSSRIGSRQICNQLWHKSPSIMLSP